MAGINKVILVGNLGKDPEVRYLDNERAVAQFSIATSDSYTDRQGQKVVNTEWHNIEIWDGLAKVAEQYLKKGDQVYIEGSIKTDKWVAKDTGENRSRVIIRARTLQMLGSRNGGTSSGSSNNESTSNNTSSNAENNTANDSFSSSEMNDDLPF